MPTIEECLSGSELYGNGFSEDDIVQWFKDEENGYYDLVQTYDRYEYSYHALNWFHAWRHLGGQHFKNCLAFGCAAGDDVKPLASQVDEFLAVEPGRKFWRSEIAGTPARFMAPSVSGDIPLPDDHVEIAVCLHVLHHIPNVSHVLEELQRVLKPGGLLVLAEPVSSMGDWRKPRRGLTQHERGLPVSFLNAELSRLRLDIVREAFCQFPLIPRLSKLLKIRCAFNSKSLVVLDRMVSLATAWNYHYHRDSVFKKFSPAAKFLIARKGR